MTNTSDQEVFNKVLFHLASQRRQAVANPEKPFSSPNDCVYRSDDGSTCSIGFLIPPDDYCSHFEEKNIVDLSSYVPVLFEYERSLLLNLQDLHDDKNNWEFDRNSPHHAFSTYGLETIATIAAEFSLEIPEAFKIAEAAKKISDE